MLGGLGQPGALPGEGGGVGTGARGLHKRPSGWMSHSPGEGGKKEGGRGAGQTEPPPAPVFPVASAHSTDGETEAQSMAGPCPELNSAGRVARSWRGLSRRPSAPPLFEGVQLRWAVVRFPSLFSTRGATS